MSIQGKIWGTTELIEKNSVLEMHRITVNENGKCSKHYHQSKWNSFYVISGELRIAVYQKDYDLVDYTYLKPGQTAKVKPGLYHEFLGLEYTVALETYWSELHHDDIVRENVGSENNH